MSPLFSSFSNQIKAKVDKDFLRNRFKSCQQKLFDKVVAGNGMGIVKDGELSSGKYGNYGKNYLTFTAPLHWTE
jgi:hypothetical protein